jgi:hypothetical protein
MQLAYEPVIPGLRAAVLDVRAGKLHASGERALADARLVVDSHAQAYTRLFRSTEQPALRPAAA